MESINNLFSVINTEDATLIYGGSEFSNWVCEMFGKLCHGLTQENGYRYDRYCFSSRSVG